MRGVDCPMPGASEFVSFFLGGVTVSGFVSHEELARIESGAVVDVTLCGVIAVHADVGEAVPLGDVPCTFIGGEPSPFVPARKE